MLDLQPSWWLLLQGGLSFPGYFEMCVCVSLRPGEWTSKTPPSPAGGDRCPQGYLCLLSGYFYFPHVPLTASKDGVDAKVGASTNPLRGTAICPGT